MLSSPTANVEQAEAELEGIVDLQNSLTSPDQTPWLTQATVYYKAGYLQRPKASKSTLEESANKESQPTVMLVSTATTVFRFPAGLAVPFQRTPSIPIYPNLSFATLAQFQQLWDKAANPTDVLVVDPSRHELVPELNKTPVALKFAAFKDVSQYSQVTDLAWIAYPDRDGYIIKATVPGAEGPKPIQIRCSGQKVSIVPQVFLAQNLKVSQGSFESVFASLDDALRDVNKDQSLSPIQVYLLQEELRSPHSFQALGLSLSPSLVSSFGAFIIFGLQWYLFLHLNELKGRLTSDSPGWNVAWIGFYRSGVARLTFLLSVALLPPVSLSLLIGRGRLRGTPFFLLILFMPLLSLVLSLYTVSLLPEKPKPAVNPTFE